MGNYLYLFHGYDSSNYDLNSVSIERIKIDINEAKCFPNPGFNSIYAVKDNILGPQIRPFTAIFPLQSANQIIYFGYTGLEENDYQQMDQQDFIPTDDESQIYYKYSLRDEYPRYHQHKQQLEWEKEEYEEVLHEIGDKIQEREVIKSLTSQLLKNIIHHPLYFRGVTFYQSNVGKQNHVYISIIISNRKVMLF